MFDLPTNDNGVAGNSDSAAECISDKNDQYKTNMINCPSVLTGMSHEMRTHMNAIVAFSFLMKDKCCDNVTREEYSKQIFSSCEQLLGLFDSFLDSAIVETGNSQSGSGIYRLDNFLDDLLSEFRETIHKEGQNILELVLDTRFSNSIEVIIDRNKVFRVMRSLFQIAIKNTKSGYIRIGYQFSEDKVTFYVLDSGQGYFKCKEFLHTEDLNQSHALHNDTYAAINITLAKKLIQMLGGTIWIECNGLTGSGIYFSVPVKMAENATLNIHKYVNTMIAI